MILKATVLVALTQLAQGQERHNPVPIQSNFSLFSFPKYVCARTHVYAVGDHESRALHTLSKCSITELSTQAPNIGLNR